MQRLVFPRHSAYCAAWNIDYWNIQGGHDYGMIGEAGAWAKVGLMLDALKDYENVIWIDTDAAIMDFNTDIREACKDIHVGACVHDPAKSDWLKQCNVPRHLNVGVIYARKTDKAKEFLEKWLASYPGVEKWGEQGSFNNLISEMPGVVTELDDKWNATVNVNMVDKPVVMGWHGVPINKRFLIMKDKLHQDWLNYRV
jgi:hypothetical protein